MNKKLRLLSGHLEESDVIIINEALDKAHKAGEQAGIEKVVKWVEENAICSEKGCLEIWIARWQAFKQENIKP